jgi:hypothetical protein
MGELTNAKKPWQSSQFQSTTAEFSITNPEIPNDV